MNVAIECLARRRSQADERKATDGLFIYAALDEAVLPRPLDGG